MERLPVIVERLLIFMERPLAETSGLSTNGLIIENEVKHAIAGAIAPG